MPEFYIIIGRKIFFHEFGGGKGGTLPPIPPVLYAYARSNSNAKAIRSPHGANEATQVLELLVAKMHQKKSRTHRFLYKPIFNKLIQESVRSAFF